MRPWLHDLNVGLMVYDNSPSPCLDISDNAINYISDPSNPGLSTAYNHAASYAKENGYDWLMLLDQDTIFVDDRYINVCLKLISELKDVVVAVPRVITAKGSLLSPTIHRHHVSTGVGYSQGKYHPLKNALIINSGMLVKVDAFLQVGGYNERVAVDLSDFQFIDRLSREHDSFYAIDYQLEQPFSNDSDDIETLRKRYRLFCRSCRNYEGKWGTRLIFILLMARRALSLSLRTGHFIFLGICLSNTFKK